MSGRLVLDDLRPRPDGGGRADAAVVATFAGRPATLELGVDALDARSSGVRADC